MLIYLSPGMLNSIQAHLYEVKASGHLLDIYKTAEAIRLEHINDNVAREDIIEKLMFFASTMAIEFNSTSVDSELHSSFANGSTHPIAGSGVA